MKSDSKYKIEFAGLKIGSHQFNFNADKKFFDRFNFSDFNAKLDYLFEQIPKSIGIGDGGNEIGMGCYMEKILELDIYPHPSVIKTSENIIASTSNWGAYGLIAGISLVEKSNFLPSNSTEVIFIGSCKSICIVWCDLNTLYPTVFEP